jgi:hypothetical protein
MNFNSSIAMKAGLIGAAVGLVIAILGRIPFLGCFIAPLGWIAAVGAGVLYVHLAGGGQLPVVSSGGTMGATGSVPVAIGEGAVGGAVAGGITGLVQALVGGVLSLLFGAAQAASSALGGGNAGDAALGAGIALVGVVVALIVGTIVAAILGAIGGLVFAAIKGQSK